MTHGKWLVSPLVNAACPPHRKLANKAPTKRVGDAQQHAPMLLRAAAIRARGVTRSASIALYPRAHSLSSSAWRAPRVSRRAAAASEAVVERVLAEHMRPGVTNLAPGTAKWRPPAELMPPPAEADNFYYGACHGEPALLDALRTKREAEDGVDMTAREMMVTNGANQAYAACLLATCDPGDEVVLFQPYYFSHLVAAQLLGLHVLLLPCGTDGQPDSEALRATLRRP